MIKAQTFPINRFWVPPLLQKLGPTRIRYPGVIPRPASKNLALHIQLLWAISYGEHGVQRFITQAFQEAYCQLYRVYYSVSKYYLLAPNPGTNISNNRHPFSLVGESGIRSSQQKSYQANYESLRTCICCLSRLALGIYTLSVVKGISIQMLVTLWTEPILRSYPLMYHITPSDFSCKYTVGFT